MRNEPIWRTEFFFEKSIKAAAKGLSGSILCCFSGRASKIQIDDVLTINYGNGVRLIQVKDLGSRRGPASEAQELYFDKSTKETTSFDLNSVSEKSNKSANKRPTKKDRRILDKIVAKTLE